jgi:hypothetical protein
MSIYDNYLEDNKDLIDVISNIFEGKKPKLGPDEVLVVKGKQEESIDIDDLRDYLKKGWELHEGKIQTKIAKTKKGKITVTDHDSLEDAKKHLEDMKKKGWNGIISQDGKPITEEDELDEVKTPKYGTTNLSKRSGGATVSAREVPGYGMEAYTFSNKTQADKHAKKVGGETYHLGRVFYVRMKESVEFDEKKSATDYEIYHKSFSAAMQHAYEYAEKKGYIVDPNEIDNKVALGPKKPSVGKTNRYDLKAGRKTAHIQVYNMNNKTYELNMYIEEVQLDEGFSQKEIKMAIGIASDKRYAGGNMTGAVKAIEKIKKGLSEHPQVKAVLKRQNEGKDMESTSHLMGDSHWEATDELVKYLRNLTPGENPETELDEDAKMAKKSDDDLISMLHQMLDADQSLPSIQHQTKRIRKELKKRGLKEDSTELDEAHGKNIDHLRDIISGKTANTLKFSDGTMKVDLFSASGIVQVYDKVNKMNQDKLDKMVNGSKKDFIKAQEIAFKLINKSKK